MKEIKNGNPRHRSKQATDITRVLQEAIHTGCCGRSSIWVINLAISLLPIAAEYRAAFSNWRIPMVWLESLLVGLIIGSCVSYSLLRFIDKIQQKSDSKSVILSFVALFIATILIDVPRSFHGTSDALYYFLIGLMFNVVRFLFLGLAIGYLYKRQYRPA